MSFAYQTLQEASASVTIDRRYCTTLSDDDRIRHVAVCVYDVIKPYFKSLTEQEKRDLAILHDKNTSESLDTYYKYHIGSETFFKDKIIRPYELFEERCTALRRFIIESPFIIILDNEHCLSNRGNVSLTLPITINLSSSRVDTLYLRNLGLLRTRIKNAQEVKILGVSRRALEILNEKIEEYGCCCTIS